MAEPNESPSLLYIYVDKPIEISCYFNVLHGAAEDGMETAFHAAGYYIMSGDDIQCSHKVERGGFGTAGKMI